MTKASFVLTAGSLLCSLACAAPPEIRFEAHTIATGLTGGYHVVVADLNHDGKPDIIALADGLSELVWYENPGWQRHVIVSGRSHMINLAAADVDGDGIPELLLADGFDMSPSASPGNVWLLHHKGDPREPWEMRLIDSLPTSHRLRVAKMGTHGEIAFINAPLAGLKSVAPDYRDAISLSLYRPGAWKRELINGDLRGVLHGIFIVDWDGDGRDDILTASFEGIHLLRNTGHGWVMSRISSGDESPWPKCGSSDVTVVRTRQGRQLAAIEPWHGNQVSIYRAEKGKWLRKVIDSSLEDGHTIQAADFAGDGEQEVVAGFRKGHSVVLYRSDQKGEWTRSVIDDHMAAAGCAVADLNGDGRIDLVCIGSATANLVWYENVTGR
ncbi:MAG: VCBS repeat-containing protein [Bryobacteraceae bacterium]|nr:VCBS repeat-containing protein [Bryobacteraceae bacterium]